MRKLIANSETNKILDYLRSICGQYYILLFFRYDKAIDPNEESYENTSKVDQYAFAVLVDDVFKGHSDGKLYV